MGCAPSNETLPLAPGWQLIGQTETSAPVDSPALSLGVGNAMRILWFGEPTMPNLRLWDGLTAPHLLPLGITPERLSAYPLDKGWLQLLWIDQSPYGEGALVGGTLDAVGSVQRGPTAISTGAVIEYAAAAAPDGSLRVVWSERSGSRSRLLATTIDGLGRPRPTVLIAAAGRFPALTFDSRGNLHFVWLEQGVGAVWTVRYVRLSGGVFPTVALAQSDPIAVFETSPGSTPESIAVQSDLDQVYALWVVAVVGAGGDIQGVRFPLEDSARVQAIAASGWALEGLGGVSGGRLAGGALFSGRGYALGGTRYALPRIPIILSVGTDGAVTATPLLKSESADLIGGVSAALDGEGRLHAAWSALSAAGVAHVYRAGE
ncbi:MAG: hypothetical protein HS103_12520 [Anaerolineales bacterium]|nr:hypothetical protein [Anaerolineales bacterium]